MRLATSIVFSDTKGQSFTRYTPSTRSVADLQQLMKKSGFLGGILCYKIATLGVVRNRVAAVSAGLVSLIIDGCGIKDLILSIKRHNYIHK